MRRKKIWQLILCASLIGSLVVLSGCDSAGAGGGGAESGGGDDEVNGGVPDGPRSPVLSPPASEYIGAVELSLAADGSAGDILYTIDGSDPATSSTAVAYDGSPIILEAPADPEATSFDPIPTEIRAIARVEGDGDSAEVSGTYQVRRGIVVASNADSGDDTLRQAITNAAAYDTIGFTDDTTIVFESVIDIVDHIRIDAGDNSVVFDGAENTSMFEVDYDVNVEVVDVTFQNGSALNAAAIGSYGNITIHGGAFLNNSATNNGGAIANRDATSGDPDPPTLVIRGTEFRDNSAGTRGGAIYARERSELDIHSAHFSANSAGEKGGAISSRGVAQLHVVSSTFERNSSLGTSSDGSGGAILIEDANDTYSQNLVISNSSFRGNTAFQSGGAIRFVADLSGVTAYIDYSEFVGNSANRGGGIEIYGSFSSDSDIYVNGATLASNHAESGGGGVANVTTTGATSSVFVTNSIVWGNSSDSGPSQLEAAAGLTINPGNPQITANYAIIETGTTGLVEPNNISDSDPLFMSAPVIGADDKWGSDDDDYGDASLEVGSPAIDAGANDLLAVDRADVDGDNDTTDDNRLDIQLNPRIVGDDVDLGAHERQEP